MAAAWNGGGATPFCQQLSAQHQCGPQCNVGASPFRALAGSRRRRLTRPAPPPQVVREFGNLYRCTSSGAQHVCDRNCSQLIQWDKWSLICKVSRKIVPLDTTATDAMAVEQDGGRRCAAARNGHGSIDGAPRAGGCAARRRGPPTAGSGASPRVTSRRLPPAAHALPAAALQEAHGR
jgi:hypothetical protein